MRSCEEKVEDHFKRQLEAFGIDYKTKTEMLNPSVDDALKFYPSKSGGSGKNYPDIRFMLSSDRCERMIPVMVEVKGTKGALIKYAKDSTEIELMTEYASAGKNHQKGDKNYSAIQKFAVNGAVHYANAVLRGGDYKEVIALGCNGWVEADGALYTECQAWYLADRASRLPLKIATTGSDFGFWRKDNRENFFRQLNELTLTEEELERRKSHIENNLEAAVKSIHQAIYDDDAFRTSLEDKQRLYLFCGLIMSCLHIENAKDFDIREHTKSNDGDAVMDRIRDYLEPNKNAVKNETIVNLLAPVFGKKELSDKNRYGHKGESIIQTLWKRVKNEVVPFLESNLHLDFAGKILNSLNDWIELDGNAKNDVVLTPRYVTSFMAKIARVNMDSYVWDCAMGSGGFLTTAMDIMIRDAEKKIPDDPKKLKEKIQKIKKEQILGIEILGNVYILACLNMFLMGDGSSNFIEGDTFRYEKFKEENYFKDTFPPTVFLLNPPYSAKGKGFNFVEFALKRMLKGRACILIQENAGSGNGLHYTKEILKHNTLLASIHMPLDLFMGKSSVQTAIYLFEVGKPHDPRANVTFVDMSNDGYQRQNRKKSSQDVNLRDIDHAKERYEEVADIILNRKPQTNYYTEANGLVIKDTISLEGNDWTFAQHRKIDTRPTLEDFKKTVKDFLSWKVSHLIQTEDCLGKR